MAERNTPRRTGGYDYVERYDVAAATTIEAGKIVALDASGNAVEYAKTASGAANTLVVVGRCEETVDNASGAAAEKQVRARTGVFRWVNGVAPATNNDPWTETVTKAQIGDAVYGENDESIRDDNHTDGGQATAAKVGRLIAVDDAGAWVATGIPFLY